VEKKGVEGAWGGVVAEGGVAAEWQLFKPLSAGRNN